MIHDSYTISCSSSTMNHVIYLLTPYSFRLMPRGRENVKVNSYIEHILHMLRGKGKFSVFNWCLRYAYILIFLNGNLSIFMKYLFEGNYIYSTAMPFNPPQHKWFIIIKMMKNVSSRFPWYPYLCLWYQGTSLCVL